MLAFALKEASQREEQTRHELFASQSRCATLEEEISSSEAQIQSLRDETVQAERRAREIEVALTESRGRQTAAECEARSWESQLRESRNKHFTQMREERRDLTGKVLALKDELMQSQASSASAKKQMDTSKKDGDVVLVDAIAKLQRLLLQIKESTFDGTNAGVTSWSEALMEMTNIVMESDKQRDELAREVSILSWHAKSLSEKLFSLELAFDEASTGRMAAEQMLLDLERAHRSQQNLDCAHHDASSNGLRMRIKATERREDELLEKARVSLEQARSQELQIAHMKREQIERERRATAMFSSCVAALSSARGVNAEDLRKNVFSETDVVGMFAMLSGSPLLTRLSSANISYNTGVVVEAAAGYQKASEADGVREIVEKIRAALDDDGIVPFKRRRSQGRGEERDDVGDGGANDNGDDEGGNDNGDGDDAYDDDDNDGGGEGGKTINETIVRELIATKVIEKRRLEEHGTLKRHCDAMRLQVFSLEDALKDAHVQIEKLQGELAEFASKTATYGVLHQSSSESSGGAGEAKEEEKGNRQSSASSPLHPYAVSVKFEREMSNCQEELREIRQRVEQKEEEVQRLSLWKAEALRREDLRSSERENVITKAREAAQLDWQGKLQRLKKQLTAQRVEFHRKEEMLKSQIQEQSKQAKDAARSLLATASSGESKVAAATASSTAAAAAAAAAAAEGHRKNVDALIQKARREREAVEEENRRLMSQLAELNAELQRNEEQRQIQKDAITDLQELMSNVSSSNAAGVERADEGVSGDTLAKELIKSKILVSELQRKLRVNVREEVRLRDTILERDARIQDLKKGDREGESSEATTAINTLPAQADQKIASQLQEIKALQKEVAQLKAEQWKDENVFQGEINSDHPLASSRRKVDPNVRELYDKLEKAKAREKALSSNIMRVSASEMKLREQVVKLRKRLRIANVQRKAASARASMLQGEAKSREENDALAKEAQLLHSGDGDDDGDNDDDDDDGDDQPHHPHTVALQELLMDKVAVEGERDALRIQNQRLKASLEASQHKHATTARKLLEFQSASGGKSSLHFHDAQHNLMGRKRLEATVRKLSDELDEMAAEKAKLLLKCERLQQHLNEVATEAATMRGKLSSAAEENALERERHRREAATFTSKEGNLTALVNENKYLNEARARFAEQVADLNMKLAEASEIATRSQLMGGGGAGTSGSLGVVFEGGGESASTMATEQALVQQALVNRLKQENRKLKEQARAQSSLMMKRLQDEKEALSEEVEQVRAESTKHLAEEKQKQKVQSRRRAESRMLSLNTIEELRKKMSNADQKASALDEAKNELETLRQRFDEEHEMFEKHAEEAKAREVKRMNEYERKLMTMDQKLKGEHARATSRIETISQALSAKESELEELRSRESDHEMDTSKLKDSLRQVKDQLAKSLAHGKASSGKIESLTTKAKALKDDLREITLKHEAQVSAIDEKDEEIEDLRHKRQHLEQSVEDLRKRLKDRSELYEKAMSEVKSKLLTSEGEADKMQFQRADALGRIEELKAHVVSLTKANQDFLADLQSSKAEAARELEASRQKVTELTQEVSVATTSIREKEREVARLSQELNFVTAARDKVAADAESLNERLSSTLVHDKMETEKEKEASRRAR